MNEKSCFRSGFAAIVGAPNAGKSTLLNHVLGQKIAITSKKPQTTRTRVLGIAHLPDAQLIFLDTPGIHKAKGVLNQRLVEVAFQAIGDADVILMMVDAHHQDAESNEIILEVLKKESRPAVLAINKVDIISKADILPMIDTWSKTYPFRAIVPISAANGVQTDALLKEIVALLPEGPAYYDEDSVTDLAEKEIAAEMIREKVVRFTGEEIPYAIAVTVEAFKKRQGKDLIDIKATIHVEKESQKAIIIGKGGDMLRRIGQHAREEIEPMVGHQIFLSLFVRVEKNWTRDPKAIQRLGY